MADTLHADQALKAYGWYWLGELRPRRGRGDEAEGGIGCGAFLDGNAFTGLGSMVSLTQGADSQITVGSGAGAYQVTSSTNTITDLVPGLTLTVTSPTMRLRSSSSCV